MNHEMSAKRPNSIVIELSEGVQLQVITPPATCVTRFGQDKLPVSDKLIVPLKSV